MNLKPTQVAFGLAVLIAILLGAVTLVMQVGTVLTDAERPVQVKLIHPLVTPPDPDAIVSSTGLVPAARSGRVAMFAGFANQPRGAFVYTFLQSGVSDSMPIGQPSGQFGNSRHGNHIAQLDKPRRVCVPRYRVRTLGHRHPIRGTSPDTRFFQHQRRG